MKSAFWERDWLQFLLDPIEIEPVEVDACQFTEPGIVLLADWDGRHAAVVRQVLREFAAHGTPVCLVHLSDEYLASPIDFYPLASVVFRNYYRHAASRQPNVLHIPLGYKSGFVDGLAPRAIGDRQHRWFFAGEIKCSRRQMLAAAEQIPGGRAVITTRWKDPNGLSTADYAAALANTVFAPCPRGNDSVDCFRVYEALEAGAIPIVEDDGRFDAPLRLMHVPLAVRTPVRPRSRWSVRLRSRFGPSYWLALYGAKFPLPRIHRWEELPGLVAQANAEELAKAAGAWWQELKRRTREQVARRMGQLQQTPAAVEMR
jgi:hypothetical protein